MNPKLIFCCGFLLLLLLSQDQARAKPLSSLQSLSRLLDEDLEHPLASEEMDQEQEDMIPTAGQNWIPERTGMLTIRYGLRFSGPRGPIAFQ
ncbi:unnamed protein product [Caretta caretta]